MCICINCRHIHQCKTYEFIEQQHEYHRNKQKTSYFIPAQTLILVNINKKYEQIFLDWDLKECSSFVEEPGYWLVLF
uniref:Ycf34 n=1 Tax=Polysiphonia sp. TaxID=1967842 RepID=A0A1Z1M3H1_9FLOR|nr:hypothetical protein [Polysiphonia sp.]